MIPGICLKRRQLATAVPSRSTPSPGVSDTPEGAAACQLSVPLPVFLTLKVSGHSPLAQNSVSCPGATLELRQLMLRSRRGSGGRSHRRGWRGSDGGSHRRGRRGGRWCHAQRAASPPAIHTPGDKDAGSHEHGDDCDAKDESWRPSSPHRIGNAIAPKPALWIPRKVLFRHRLNPS